MKPINIEKWGTFPIGELFDIHPTKAYKLTNSSLMEENGVNPVVVNSSFNNGIGGYTNQETTEKGGIISEFKNGSPPYNSNFPKRNRIISGLSEALVVVEAGLFQATVGFHGVMLRR